METIKLCLEGNLQNHDCITKTIYYLRASPLILTCIRLTFLYTSLPANFCFHPLVLHDCSCRQSSSYLPPPTHFSVQKEILSILRNSPIIQKRLPRRMNPPRNKPPSLGCQLKQTRTPWLSPQLHPHQIQLCWQ